VVAGGGGAKFGLKNAILSFKYDNINGFADAIYTVEMDSIPLSIHSYEGLNIFCACADATTFMYELRDNGTFTEIFRFKANDFSDKQFVFQTICKFLPTPETPVICTGMTDGNLK